MDITANCAKTKTFQDTVSVNRPQGSHLTLRRSASCLILAGAVAVVIGTLLPWLEGHARPKGLLPGPFALSLILVPDGKTVAAAAGAAGLIGIALLLRRFVLVAGIAVLVPAAIAGRIAAVYYFDLGRYVANVPSLFAASVGPGPYLTAIGLLVWVFGGLVAIAIGIKDTRFGSSSALRIRGISGRGKRAIVLIVLAAAFSSAAGFAYLTTPSALLSALCRTECETSGRAQPLESLTPIAKTWSAIQTQACAHEYQIVQEALDAYMAYFELSAIVAADNPTHNMTSPVPLYNEYGIPTFMHYSPTNFAYTWDASGHVLTISQTAYGPPVPVGCVASS
jgi:hypothetical protein